MFIQSGVTLANLEFRIKMWETEINYFINLKILVNYDDVL
jgi:hypothetical protein